MNISLAQINTTPRDFQGNLDKIFAAIAQAAKDQSRIVVFPELTIPGYLTRDMVYSRDYVRTCLENLQRVVNVSSKYPNLYIVLGYIDTNRTGVGKPYQNMAAVINNGVVVATYAKQLLPFYDVFDEARYFEPGNSPAIVEIDGVKWGITICEDLWNDKGSDDYNYKKNPLRAYRKLGIKNIISLNSSPFVRGKPRKRIDLFSKSELDTLVYVNQIGGQDELVFDGNSFILKANEGHGFFEPDMQEGVFTATPQKMGLNINLTASSAENELATISKVLDIGIRDYVRKSGFTDVVVASSGGIDSAIVIAKACDALGAEHVHGIRMPSIYSSKGSVDDALLLHQNLGCHDYLHPIAHEDLIKDFAKSFRIVGDYNKVADENIQARLRGNALMFFSNALGALPLTTGNKTEMAVGYFTIYGDSCGGFAPISDLYKTEVYDLARYLNHNREIIPNEIVNKAPSAELRPDQTDESSLLPYSILDKIVKEYVEEYIGSFDNFAKKYPKLKTWANTEKAPTEYRRIIKLIDSAEYKRRQAAPGIKLSQVAFGTGRRLPIVKGVLL